MNHPAAPHAEERASPTPPGPTPPGGRARRRLRRRRDRRGVALVMVLGAITVLTVFLTELQEETSTELSAALADRDALRAEYYARSAVNLSRMLIAAEPSVSAAIGPMLAIVGVRGEIQVPIWRFTDIFLGPFNAQLVAPGEEPPPGAADGSAAGGKNLGLTGGGRFELKIVDEDAKLNINRAADDIAIQDQLAVAGQLFALMAPAQYNPLFEERDGDGQFSDRTAICSALIDWADPGDQLFNCDLSANAQGSTGAEDSIYQTLGLAYQRKNAPYDSLEELRLVRGMGDDFWATFVDPDPNDPDKRVLTVWGNRKQGINVTTASPQALLALTCSPNLVDVATTALCNDPIQMTSFLTVVSLVQGLTGGLIFPSAADYHAAMTQQEGKSMSLGSMLGQQLKAMGVEPVKFKTSLKSMQRQGLIGNKTKFLSIYADGVVPGNKRETRVRIHAVLDMTGAGKLSEPGGSGGGGGGGAGGAGGSGAAATQDNYESLVRSNPAGTIIYYRIQ
ncbi:general secretion pathway protein GspK [Sorangium cellulosum]|uniref:General secretion pathway protein GspK n=1 Tax=Sorangium cellulosum TaxID=56 RepID=A0A4P2QEY6_SORCE|nr:type II secretion system protein GspK [Sorangium cellulosum]AUX27753.1 general secretion pathway protein GspK [Sorangium cellulosum]